MDSSLESLKMSAEGANVSNARQTLRQKDRVNSHDFDVNFSESPYEALFSLSKIIDRSNYFEKGVLGVIGLRGV